MRKCLGVLMLCTFLLTFGSTANAKGIWVAGSTGNWSDATKWDAPPGSPSTESVTIGDGTATLDISQQIGILLVDGIATKTGTVNVNSGSNLTLYKSGSTNLLNLAATATGAGVINHSSGTVTVGNGAGTGEVRLSNVAGATGNYNLSGSGILDVEYLNRGAKDRAGYFTATGGTLAVRNLINKFGRIAENASYGFNQGTCKLEVGAISTVAAIGVGQAGNSMDYTVGTGGTLNFDIASASSYDKVLQFGDLANTAGATLGIDLLGGYTPAVGSFFDVWTFSAYTNQTTTSRGSGTFASISSSWTAAWVDTNADLTTDTLRLTYVPEPATIALLGLGLLAIRRNKK